jgi:hypothetical protein
MSTENLRDALDEYQLVFGEDLDELELRENGGEPLASWGLSSIVDDLLDVMETPRERDDVLHLARHFEGLAKRIRKTIDDIEGA